MCGLSGQEERGLGYTGSGSKQVRAEEAPDIIFKTKQEADQMRDRANYFLQFIFKQVYVGWCMLYSLTVCFK